MVVLARRRRDLGHWQADRRRPARRRSQLGSEYDARTSERNLLLDARSESLRTLHGAASAHGDSRAASVTPFASRIFLDEGCRSQLLLDRFRQTIVSEPITEEALRRL